jgi:hypothetical protein
MLFPLGSACKVRESIQRYLNVDSLQTNIFDWVSTNFDSIIYIISNINTPLKAKDFYEFEDTENFYKLNVEYLQSLKKRAVFHKNIRFDTLHDFPINKSYEESLPLFLERYNVRLNRLKTTIMQTENINFIHLLDIIPNHRIPNQNIYVPTVDQIYTFFQKIKKINIYCNCKLHILIPPFYCKHYKKNFIVDSLEIEKIKLIPNVFVHYLYQDEDVKPFHDQCCHWSWDEVYDSIEKKNNL